MAVVSEHWPFINPATIDDFPVLWWAYYVRAAKHKVDESQKANRTDRR